MPEPARLCALEALGIMDTKPEATFDALVDFAASLFDVPIALLTFVDDHRQWFKARHGLAVSETPRDIAFCAVVVETGELLVVEDAHHDPRFSSNPLVLSEPRVRFYAGAPLVLASGARVGSFALIDHTARPFGPEERKSLLGLARVAAAAIEQRVGKLAERARSAARSGALMAAALDGIVIADNHGCIVELNPAAERIVGLPRAAALGLPASSLVPPRLLRDSARVWAARGASSVLARRLETFAVHASGHEVPIEITLSQLPVEPPEFAAFVRDLTEQRALESQLLHAQKMEAVGRLAGGIAHDFNNTLAVILSYASLLDQSLDVDDTRRSDVLELTKAGQHAAKLTAQLLAFSRKQPLQPKVLLIDELLLGLSSMLARLLGPDIVISWQLDARAAVRVDPGTVEQVVMNLAINARDAMPDGGQLVVKTCVVSARGAELVQLSMTDTGSGMDPATVSRIFEPFFTTKGMEGTGLGLSMVLGAVEQSGGFVNVASDVGKGTTFEIHLPVSLAVAGSVTPRPAARRAANGETILLVDDEEAVRLVAKRLLQGHGYRVLEASNAALAIEVSAKTPGTIDLLLTDLAMPGMNGEELAEKLVAARPGLKVLCMSGFAEEPVLRRMTERGFAFMPKPFDIGSIRERVRETLDESAP